MTVKCPWCDYEGLVSSVEAHISGSTDEAHEGKVGHDLADHLPDQDSDDEQEPTEPSIEDDEQATLPAGVDGGSETVGGSEGEESAVEATSDGEKEGLESALEATSESAPEGGSEGGDRAIAPGRKVLAATLLFLVGAVVMAVDSTSSQDDEQSGDESNQDDEQTDTPLIEGE